jgi:hypothetical protein
MIDPTTLSMVRDTVTIFGVIAGFTYYVLTVRATRKNQQQQLETRQAQLFMSLYQTFRSPEFIKNWDHVNWRLEFKDWEDSFTKLHPVKNPENRTIWFSVAAFFEGVGVLLRRNLIDISLVNDLLGNVIIMTWESMGPTETESRSRLNNPDIWTDFEYAYNEILRYSGTKPGTFINMKSAAQQYYESPQ